MGHRWIQCDFSVGAASAWGVRSPTAAAETGRRADIDLTRAPHEERLTVGDSREHEEVLRVDACSREGVHLLAVRLASRLATLRIGAKRTFFFLFLNSSFRGRNVSCETPRVMPHCTSGLSLRWFHYRLVGIVGTLCG